LAVVLGLQGIAYVAFLEATALGLIFSVALFGITAWGVPAIMEVAMGDVGQARDATTAFGHVTTVMGAGQAVGPLLAGAVADATGIVSSGLWIATLATLGGVGWSLGEAAMLKRAGFAARIVGMAGSPRSVSWGSQWADDAHRAAEGGKEGSRGTESL
jgi:predicted MFS family arabinose efflux permease